MTEKFQVQFLVEAAEFLDNLDEKAREKIYYTIQKARFSNEKELFKNWKAKFGSSEPYLTKLTTGFLLFGTRQGIMKQLSYLRTE